MFALWEFVFVSDLMILHTISFEHKSKSVHGCMIGEMRSERLAECQRMDL